MVLRAKTDRLDANAIARVLRSFEARPDYVPTELIATYRELVRLHSQLSDDIGRYKNEIHALLTVLFPEFTQVFLDPCRPTALALLKRYPSAQAMATAGVEAVASLLHELAPRHYGLKTAQQLVSLAQHTVSSGIAASARASTLKVLCEQLEHTHTNLAQLEHESDTLLDTEKASERRAECARVRAQDGRGPTGGTGGCDARMTRADQVVAYAGLDIAVRQSGKWRGEAKLSKRGSGGCAASYT